MAVELERVRNTATRNNLLPCDDYLELLDLAVVMNPYAEFNNFTMKKPRACNKARWMCVWLYILLILKMFKLQNQSILDYTDNYKQHLTRFVKFLVLI